VRDIVVRGNSLAGQDPVSAGFARFIITLWGAASTPRAVRWTISDNVFWPRNTPSNGWWLAEVSGSYATLPSSWGAWTKTGTLTERNVVVGVTDAAAHVTTPFGASNSGFSSPAAANMDPATLVISAGAALTGAADGGPIGVDFATLTALSARATTGRD
jgi:hypothetical protein